jgi:hypothetical protein
LLIRCRVGLGRRFLPKHVRCLLHSRNFLDQFIWLVTLELITHADLRRCNRCLSYHFLICHVLAHWLLGQALLILASIRSLKDFFVLLGLQELIDLICHIRYFHLFAHAFDDLQRLTEVEHVHILEDLFGLVLHYGQADSLDQKFIDLLFFFLNSVLIEDRCRQSILIIVFGAEILQRFPIIDSEDFLIQQNLTVENLGFKLGSRQFFRVFCSQ